ncbi:MAG: hypothetical protein HY607_06080 [Planctomycetes bacterium]|nr:hypothetical protein [Planctomycetota bacterium]
MKQLKSLVIQCQNPKDDASCWHNNAVRRFVIWGAYYGFLMPIIRIAEDHPALRHALFDSVSGKRAYREILLNTISIPLLLKISATIIRRFVKRIFQVRP